VKLQTSEKLQGPNILATEPMIGDKHRWGKSEKQKAGKRKTGLTGFCRIGRGRMVDAGFVRR
jgi:hypothetical protein